MMPNKGQSPSTVTTVVNKSLLPQVGGHSGGRARVAADPRVAMADGSCSMRKASSRPLWADASEAASIPAPFALIKASPKVAAIDQHAA